MSTATTVKERDEPVACTSCGAPTWSGTGVCFRCRSAEDPTILPPPVIPPPLVPPIVEPQRHVSVDEGGRIAEDIACRSCGYNLRGLPPDAACPECSTPVERSIRGDLLRFSNPAWVRRLSIGTWLIIAGLILQIVIGVGLWFVMIAMMGMSGGNDFAAATAMQAGAALLFVGMVALGVWLVTWQDPSASPDAERAFSARRLARWCVIAQVLAAPAQAYVNAGMNWMGAAGPLAGPGFPYIAAAGLLLGLVGLIGYVAALQYMSKLALRIPAPSIASQTRVTLWGFGLSAGISLVLSFLMWIAMSSMMTAAGMAGAGPPPSVAGLFAIAGVGGCISGLGYLVFGIWIIVLLFIYAAKFASCAKEAETNWV